MNKYFLIFATIIIVFSLILCACEDKKEEEQTNVDVVDTTEPGKVVLEKTYENESQFYIMYNDVVFALGNTMDSIKESLGQESKPSDTSKACGPDVKGDTTHYYYDGLTIDVNYAGIINGAYLSEGSASLRSGARVGMTVEDIKTLINGANEDEYSLNYYVGDNMYITMVKADDDTIMSISVGDMSIEN